MTDCPPEILEYLRRAIELAERLAGKVDAVRSVLEQWKDIEITPEHEMVATLWTMVDEALGEVND